VAAIKAVQQRRIQPNEASADAKEQDHQSRSNDRRLGATKRPKPLPTKQMTTVSGSLCCLSRSILGSHWSRTFYFLQR